MGKGKGKAKSNRKSKGKGKGRKGGKLTWGEKVESASSNEDEFVRKSRKRPRQETQEIQDKERRLKLLCAVRERSDDVHRRLARPNHKPEPSFSAAVLEPKPKPRRPRPSKPRPGRNAARSLRRGQVADAADEKEETGKNIGAYERLLASIGSRGRSFGGVELADLVAVQQLDEAGYNYLDESSDAALDNDDSDGDGEEGNEEESGSDDGGGVSNDQHAAGVNGNGAAGADTDDGDDDDDDDGVTSHDDGDDDGNGGGSSGGDAIGNREGSSAVANGAADDNGTSGNGFISDGSDSDMDSLVGTAADPAAAVTAAGSADPYLRRFVLTRPLPEDEAERRLLPSARPAYVTVAGGGTAGAASTPAAKAWVDLGLALEACGTATVPPPLSDGAEALEREWHVRPTLSRGFVAANAAAAAKAVASDEESAADAAATPGTDRAMSRTDGAMTPTQALLLPPLLGYTDLLYSAWTMAEDGGIRRAYALHVLNHVLKTRDRIARHDRRLRRAAAATAAAAGRGAGGRQVFDLAALAGGDGAADGRALAVGGGGGAARIGAASKADGRRKKSAAATAAPEPVGAPICTDLAVVAMAGTAGAVAGEEGDWKKDQGFVRPTVLVLLPFRSLAFAFVEALLAVLGPRAVVTNWQRFQEEYGPEAEATEGGGDRGGGGGSGSGEDGDGEGSRARAVKVTRRRRARAVLAQKPEDWKALFAGGRNGDDEFKLGIALAPGGCKARGKGGYGAGNGGDGRGNGKGVGVRLYSEFYASDIVVASPLGLHLAMGEKTSPDHDTDFLSSIEVCVMDRADLFLQQNWLHLAGAAAALNGRPRRAAGIDFSRIRDTFVHGQAALFRQTVLLSAFADAAPNALFARYARSLGGGLRATPIAAPLQVDGSFGGFGGSGGGYGGVGMASVAVRVRQVFQRVPCATVAAQADARFAYFEAHVLSRLLPGGRTAVVGGTSGGGDGGRRQPHTVLFVPSYFDFVRLRNQLTAAEASACYVSEYTKPADVTRARARLFRGERDLLVYTGRAHFFHRHRLRGVRHLVLYGLPDYPHFYGELINMLDGGGGGGDGGGSGRDGGGISCLALFTRFDRLALARIVGEDRARHMLASPTATFLFR